MSVLHGLKECGFNMAICALKAGNKVSREGWNGKGMYLYLVRCSLPFPKLDEGGAWKCDAFPDSSFIVMKTADGNLVPWLASQTDLLADDWAVIE